MFDKKILNAFLSRMHSALEDIDTVSNTEESEEFCAEIEDLLFFIESIDPNEEDSDEEIYDTLQQLIETCESAEDIDVDTNVILTLAQTALNNLK